MCTELAIAAAIVSVSLIIHMAGILLMGNWLLLRREELEQSLNKRRFALLLLALFAWILFLHVVQISLWAVFYYTQELFSDLRRRFISRWLALRRLDTGMCCCP